MNVINSLPDSQMQAHRAKRLQLLGVAFTTAMMLAACGGDGGSSAPAPTPTAPSPAPTSPTPPPPAPASYSVGGTVSGLTGTLVLQDNAQDALTVTANGSFSFATKLATAAAYDVTVGTQPSGQTCTVSSGSGQVASANVTSIAVTCATASSPPPASATSTMYMDGGDTKILQLQLASDGTVTQKSATPTCTGKDSATGDNDADPLVALSHDGAHLYSTTGTQGEVCSYNVASDGTLSATNPAFTAASSNALGIIASPSASIVVADDITSSSYNVFSIAADGTLTAQAPQDVGALTGNAYYGQARVFGFSRDGSTLYTVLVGETAPNNCQSYALVPFSIGANGALTYSAGTALLLTCNTKDNFSQFTGNIAINHAGTAIYIADIQTGVVYEVGVAAGGGLSLLGSGSISAGGSAAVLSRVVVAPDDKGVFVIDAKNNVFRQYVAGADGSLSANATATVAACPVTSLFSGSENNPTYAAFDETSGVLWVGCNGNQGLRAFTVGSGDSLSVLKDTQLSQLNATLPNVQLVQPQSFVISH